MMTNNTIMKNYKWNTFMGLDTYLLNEILEEQMQVYVKVLYMINNLGYPRD